VVLAAFFLVVLSGLAATVLFVNDGRNYKRLVRQFGLQTYLLPPPPVPVVRIGRQRRLVASSRQLPRLVRPLAYDTARLIPPVSTSIEERCEALADMGGEPSNFLAGSNEWECTFFRQFGEGDDPASLFIQAKGIGDDDLRTFRIKLSFTDERQAGALLQAALTALDGYGLSLTPQSRAYLEVKLSTRAAFKTELENYRATFNPEMMDQRRFNLLIVAHASTMACVAPATEPGSASQRAIATARVGCLTLPSGQAFSPPD
jgi:hypothetical protein